MRNRGPVWRARRWHEKPVAVLSVVSLVAIVLVGVFWSVSLARSDAAGGMQAIAGDGRQVGDSPASDPAAERRRQLLD